MYKLATVISSGLVLVFGEAFGLWNESFDPGASVPVLVGSGMNLLLMSLLANTLAFHKEREILLKTVATQLPR